MKGAEYWIEGLGLEPHPEGGFYSQTYRAEGSIASCCLPKEMQGSRAYSTAIYFLLHGKQSSALHRIRSDEIWHFYTGASLTLHCFTETGEYSTLKLGPDFEYGEVYQAEVPAGCWFGATVNVPSSYSLVGCTVAPGFDFQDFELGKREELIRLYPEHERIITRLTG